MCEVTRVDINDCHQRAVNLLNKKDMFDFSLSHMEVFNILPENPHILNIMFNSCNRHPTSLF